MYILIFITAITASILLDRQDRRHRYERNRECQRHGLTMPEPRPRIQTLESISTMVFGLLIFLGCGTMVAMQIIVAREVGDRVPMEPGLLEMPSVGIAAGIAMMILGFISLKRNIIYQRSHPKSSTPLS